MAKEKLYTEEQLQQAILAIENGTKLRAASRTYGTPLSTLSDRYHGARSVKEAHDDQKLLSQVQEDMLANWIRGQYFLLQAATHRQIRLIAQGILRTSGSSAIIHHQWSYKFLKRRPSLKHLKGQKLDTQRVKGVDPDKIQNLFKQLVTPFLSTIRP